MAIKRGAYITVLVGMLIVLIFDTKTAVFGASQGITMCLKSVIPSLFPFLFLSSLIGAAMGQNYRVLAPLGRLCHMPSGSEGILVLGLLGGYPVGAKLITQQYQSGKLSKETAHRLMGFCNNPGPAFIFGMLWDVFQNKYALWALWGIQILSAILVGIILPRKETTGKIQMDKGSQDIVQTLGSCVRTMGIICGWIVVFRMIIAYLQQWIFPFLPDAAQVICAGVLELTNGCHLLTLVQPISLRFILCAGILSFGGICVTLQTASAASGQGLGWYLPGKILQTGISVLLSIVLQGVIFKDSALPILPAISTFCVVSIVYFLISRKNSSISVKYAV